MRNIVVGILLAIIVIAGVLLFLKRSTINTPQLAPPPTVAPTQLPIPTDMPTSTTATTSSQATQPTTVTLTQQGFSPQTITIKAGEKIIWLNKSGETATVNSDPHPIHNLYPILNLGEFPNNGKLELVISKAGKYTYHNHYQPSHRGTIIVQ